MRVSFNPGRDRHSRLRFRLAHLPDNWVWLGDGNRRVGLAEKKKKKRLWSRTQATVGKAIWTQAKELRLSPVEICRPCLRSLLPVTKIGPSKCGLNDKEI